MMAELQDATAASPLLDDAADPAAPPAQQQPATQLVDLPPNALAIILHQAGLHTRLVCRTFHTHHPPLLSLTPDSLPTPAALTAAIATLPASLTSLDLRRIDSPPHNPLTDHHLATICTRLPHLQHLLLPKPNMRQHTGHLTPAIYGSLVRLSHLHTLRAYTFAGPPGRRGAPPFHHPRIATRLRSLHLPGSFVCALLAAPPSALPHVTALSLEPSTFGKDNVLSHWPASHSEALSAAAPALRSLDFGHFPENPMHLHDDQPLAALSALTALTLPAAGICSEATQGAFTFPTELLHHIGTLTNLCSLSVYVVHYGWDAREAGWLSRLTQLTHLAVRLERTLRCADDYWEEGYGHQPESVTVPWADHEAAGQLVPATALPIASVARDAAQLPLLQSLQLGYIGPDFNGFDGDLLAYGTPHSFLRHLAAATQLRCLCLDDFPLPASETHQLTSLQHLTCLLLTAPQERLLAGDGRPGDTYAYVIMQGAHFDTRWATALQGLSELGLERTDVLLPRDDTTTVCCPCRGPGAVPSCSLQVVAALTSLHTLRLPMLPRGLDLGAVLRRLRGTLVRLDLSDMQAVYLPALGELEGMAQLQLLDLGGHICYTVSLEELAHHLRLPGSLRRCLLSHKRSPQAEATLRQQYPLVDFRWYR